MRARSPGESMPSDRIRAIERLSPASRVSRRAVSRAVSWPLATPCAIRSCWRSSRRPMRPASAGAANASERAAAAPKAMAKVAFLFMYLASGLSTIGMGAGLQDGRGRRLGPALVFAAAALLLARSAPLARAYADKLLSRHSAAGVAVAAAGSLAVFLSAWAGLRKRPRATAAAFAATAAAMVALSGNLGAALAAAAILLVTFVAGDAVYRVLRGTDAARGDLSTALAAGFAACGVAVLLLGEAGVLGRGSVLALAAIVVGLRRRRLPALGRLVSGCRETSARRRASVPRGGMACFRRARAPGRLGGGSGAGRVVGRARVPPARGARHRAHEGRAAAAGPPSPVAPVEEPRGLPVDRLLLRRRACRAVSAVRGRPRGLRRGALARAPPASPGLGAPRRPGNGRVSDRDAPAQGRLRRLAGRPARDGGRRRSRRESARTRPDAGRRVSVRSGGRDQGLRALRRPRARCAGIPRAPAADASLRRGPLRPASARALARLGPAPRRIVSGALRRLTARAGGPPRRRPRLREVAGDRGATPRSVPCRARGRVRPAPVRSRLSLQPIRGEWRRLQRDPGAPLRRGTGGLERGADRSLSRGDAAVSRAVVASLPPVDPISLPGRIRCTRSSRPAVSPA